MEATILKAETTEGRAPGGVSVELLIRRVVESDNPVKVYDELVPLLARLSPGEYAAAKTELREHFKRRLSVTDLEKAVKAARKGQRRARLDARAMPGAGQAAARPVVEVGGQLRDVVAAALSALALANREKPSIFVQSGRLVTVHFSEKKKPGIEPLTLSSLRYKMTLSADYVSIRDTTEDTIAIAVDPPLDIVRVILEGMDAIDYPFPPLSGITELPIMRPDGSIHQTPGYDAETEQVYIPGDLVIPPIPMTPGPGDIADARAKLDFWLADFPFVDASSKATALANTITAVIRPVIAGQVPLTLLDAPKQGSGKTILAQGIGIVATGRIVPTNAPTNDEEEWRKKILTWLQTSPAVLIIDNVIHLLESSSLNTALTSPYIEDRLLSTNELIRAENRAIWFASGNNIRVGDDTARRCIKCRLDARMEKPWQRQEFKIPGGVRGFFQWTIEHRAELVTAVLILARNWFAKGKPAPDVTPLGSFEDWTAIVGGILQAAGIPDFLVNLNDEDGNSSIDEVTAEWKAFIDAVHGIYGDKPFSCAELAKLMLPEDDTTAELLRDTIPTSITKNLDSYMRSKGVDREFAKHMGIVLKLRKGQMFGTLRLEWKGRNRENKVQWQIVNTADEAAAARNLLTSIEEKGGKVMQDSGGNLLVEIPGYTIEQWRALNRRVQAATYQICRLRGWKPNNAAVQGSID